MEFLPSPLDREVLKELNPDTERAVEKSQIC